MQVSAIVGEIVRKRAFETVVAGHKSELKVERDANDGGGVSTT
jgi:hypothetical protein